MQRPGVPSDADIDEAGASTRIMREDGRLRIEGPLTIAAAAGVEQNLRDIGAVREIDVSGVTRIDTVGAWLLHRLQREGNATITGLKPHGERLLKAVSAADRPAAVHPERLPFLPRELQRVGDYMVNFVETLTSGLAFLGLTLISAWRVLRESRNMRWNSVSHQMEQTGIDALAIVGLMSFLVGIVIAQQGAVQLQQFGAEIFTINLIGRATFRELGILLTAIMVAGRSASAFAAQIGSMKLAEEIDAMRTIGLDPVELLVLPRVVALIAMMPLLAFYASICAIVGGGLFTWVSLGIPPATFVQRLREVVPMTDLWVGLLKAPVFGAMIAVIGCFQGFQVSGNAESVGTRTTLAVVQAIFLVIVLDAFFAVFFTQLGMI